MLLYFIGTTKCWYYIASLVSVSYKTYKLVFGHFLLLVLGDWVTLFEVLWSGLCARLVSQSSTQIVLGFLYHEPAKLVFHSFSSFHSIRFRFVYYSFLFSQTIYRYKYQRIKIELKFTVSDQGESNPVL